MDKETIMQLLADGVISNEVAAKYFPDLKESRDERIRQFLIRFVKHCMAGDYSDEFSKEDCLAWLEWQGEQKLDDKVKPKFKVGDNEQKPAVWSKEDEIRQETTLDDLESFLVYIKQKPPREILSLRSKESILTTIQKDIDWIKTIKDRIQTQNTWKPSDEYPASKSNRPYEQFRLNDLENIWRD